MNLAANSAPDQAVPPVDANGAAGANGASRPADGANGAGGAAGGSRPAAVHLLLFAAARVAAGTASERVGAGTVGEVLDEARSRYGGQFAAVLDGSRVWVNGEPAALDRDLLDGDEIAVLPPVSGGACGTALDTVVS